MGRLLCLVGIHRWQHHVNRQIGGTGGGYDLCSRCGREKDTFEEGRTPDFKGPPSQQRWTGPTLSGDFDSPEP